MSHEFADWTALVDHAEKAPTDLPASSRDSRETSNDSWSGTATFEEALSLARKGWPEGRERILALRDRFYNRLAREIEKPETVFAVYGGSLNMGRVMAGHPKPFIRRTKTNVPAPGHGKVVTVVLNISASSAVDKAQLFTRGAACAALVELLELAGRRCRVVIGEAVNPSAGGRGSGAINTTLAEIKRPDMPLNMDILAFSLAHASTLRRIIFSINETEDPAIRNSFGFHASSGYGVPCQLPKESQGDIYFGAMYGREWNDEGVTEAFIEKELTRQGVNLLK